MDRDEDALVGLRFEVSGGLGRMSGRILGKAGALYLVQRQGAEHMELLALDDLRPAKFYADAPAAPPEEPAEAAAPGRRRLAEQIRKKLGGS